MNVKHRTFDIEHRRPGPRPFFVHWQIKVRCSVFGVRCPVLLLFIAAAALRVAVPLLAQPAFVGSATNFSMAEYYDPPNETKMKSLILGAEASPLPGGRYLIRKARVEFFNETGARQMIVESPECFYDAARRTANSAGPMHAFSDDGNMSIRGVGFLWRQDASALTISNQVHTTIRDADLKADQR